MFKLNKNQKPAGPDAARGEMIMKRMAVVVAVLMLIFLNGIPLPEKIVFAAEKTVQMNVPGCMT